MLLRSISASLFSLLVLFGQPAFGQIIVVGTNETVSNNGFGVGVDIGFDPPPVGVPDGNDFFVSQFNPALGTLNSVTVEWFSSFTFHTRIAQSGGGAWTVSGLEYIGTVEVYGPGPTDAALPNVPPTATGVSGIDGLRYPHNYTGAFTNSGGTRFAPDTLESPFVIGAGAGGALSRDDTVSEATTNPRLDGTYNSLALDFPDANGNYLTGLNSPRESFTLVGANGDNLSAYIGTGNLFFDAFVFAESRGSFTNNPVITSTWDANFRIQVTYNFTPVPEPSTYAMAGILSVIGLAFCWRTKHLGRKKLSEVPAS